MSAPAHSSLGEEQFEALYDRHGQSLLRYVIGLTFGDQHLAEDIVQETFLRAWRTPQLVTDRGGSCRGWLTTVARNVLIDRLRCRGRRPQEVGEGALPLIPDPTCEMDRVVTSLTVRRALAQLAPVHRQILVELYFRQHSLTEVAQRLRVPTGTAKSRAHYALRALRQLLEEQSPVVTDERRAA
jgi:RNA polymerase sigma-70 factor (ECF subfamily)